MTVGRLTRAVIACVLATAVVTSVLPGAVHAAAEPGVTLQRPAPTLTTGEIARMAGEPTTGSAPIQVLVVSTPRGDISWQEFAQLANGRSVSGITVVSPAQDVAPSTTVGSLTNGQPPPVAKGCGPICRQILKILAKVIVIILIIFL
jgi:hypothetical protein